MKLYRILLAIVVSITATTAQAQSDVEARISKSGKLLVYMPVTTTPINGINPPSPVNAINNVPTVYRNGSPITIGSPIWFPYIKVSPLAMYQLQCGKVEAIAVVDGGSGYTNKATVNIDESKSGGTGLKLGSPILNSGVTDYKIISSGSGYAMPPKVVFTDTSGTGATGYAVVYKGVVSKVVMTNPGSGYTPQATVAFDYTGVAGAGATGKVVLDGNNGVGSVYITNFGTASDGPVVTVAVPPGVSGPKGNIQAKALAIISDTSSTTPGSVRTIVPLVGGLLGCGSGYVTPPIVTITGNATATAVVSSYVSNIPVLSSGSYNQPPRITLTDTAASRSAVFQPLMSGATATDTFTYDAAAGWLSADKLPSVPAKTGAPIVNYVGQDEAPYFNVKSTMRVGANLGAQPSTRYSNYFTAKNKLHVFGAAKVYFGPGVLNSSNDGTPISWTSPSNSVIGSLFYGPTEDNGIDAMGASSLSGDWTLQYNDQFVNTPNATASWLGSWYDSNNITITPAMLSGPSAPITIPPANITLTNGAVTSISLDGLDLGGGWQGAGIQFVNAASTGFGSAVVTVNNGVPKSITVVTGGTYASKPTVVLYGTRVSGTEITSVWNVRYIPTTVPGTGPTEWSPTLTIEVAQAQGRWNLGNPWIVSPDAKTHRANTNLDRSDQYAVDDSVLANLKQGTPSAVRFMDATGSFGGGTNIVNTSDIPNLGLGWAAGSTNRVVKFASVRPLNTDPAKGPAGDNTYPYVSTKLYGRQAVFNQGPDDFGNYLPILPSDGGAFIASAPWLAAFEVRSDQPHRLETGVYGVLSGTVSAPMQDAPNFVPGIGWIQTTFFVTGPNTAVFGWYVGGGTNTKTFQTVKGNVEVPCDWSFSYNVPLSGTNVPYEYAAAFCRQVGSDLWLNIPHSASNEAIREIMRRVISQIGPKAKVYIEYGNENWNFAYSKSMHAVLVTILNELPPGVQVLGVTTATGQSYGNLIRGLMASNTFEVAEQVWAQAGLDTSRIKRVAGLWMARSDLTVNDLSAFKITGRRIDHGAVAFYPGFYNDTPLVQAFAPSGGPFGNAGSLQADGMIDTLRWHNATNQYYWGLWKTQADALANSGTGATMVGYEGSLQNPIPSLLPNAGAIQHDIFFHSYSYDAIKSYLTTCQVGDPRYPNTGEVLHEYFEMFMVNSGNNVWRLATGAHQQPGPGTNNQFATIQGGTNFDGHSHEQQNESPMLKGFLDRAALIP